ncbi:MAG: YbaB/EbfC family nucleoid-associated protein [Actinobacteria bacterium]|nr:YbaB/EbfC family nucleoid-associated protein [Actinomycetota bacterium]
MVDPAGVGAGGAGDPGGVPGLDIGALIGSGGLDLGALMEQASQLQEQLAEAQARAEEEAAATLVTGAAGGRAVEIDVTGSMEFVAVRIDPSAVDASDVEMLQDLVLAALHDAMEKVADVQEAMLAQGPPLPDLPDLGGLLG